jgi:hypothetical protein
MVLMTPFFRNENHVLWLFYIFTELKRPQHSTAKGLFEKALDSDVYVLSAYWRMSY